MDTATENVREYKVISVEKTDAPSGMEGDNWYTYIIERERSAPIVGTRSGTKQQVTKHAEEYAASLNERAGAPGGSIWASQINQKKKK